MPNGLVAELGTIQRLTPNQDGMEQCEVPHHLSNCHLFKVKELFFSQFPSLVFFESWFPAVPESMERETRDL